MYKCPKCGSEFEIGQKFCPNCGYNLELNFIEHPICPKCKKTFPAGTQFCDQDGCKLVSQDMLVPTCQICGQTYSSDIKFCPKDGGAVLPKFMCNNIDNTVRKKASLMNRFLAYIIDALIIVLLSLPSIVFYVVALQKSESDYSYYSTDGASDVVWYVLAIFFYIFPLLYSLLKDGMRNGQSLGKKAMHIRTISINNSEPCSLSKSFIRNFVGGLLSAVPFVGWLVEPLMVLCTEDGRRLGDRAAETMVIE